MGVYCGLAEYLTVPVTHVLVGTYSMDNVPQGVLRQLNQNRVRADDLGRVWAADVVSGTVSVYTRSDEPAPRLPSPLSLQEQMEIQELLELGFMPSEVMRIYADAGCTTQSLLHYLYPPPFGGTGVVPPTHQPRSGRRYSG